MWRALRQEGFTPLAARFAALPVPEDAVEHLAALVAEHVTSVQAEPELYRVMSDASVELEDLGTADATLEHLVVAAARARADGRLRADAVALDVATRAWATAHGVVSLVAGGPLPAGALGHAPVLLTALLVAEGDDPARSAPSRRCAGPLARGRPAEPHHDREDAGPSFAPAQPGDRWTMGHGTAPHHYR